MTTTETTVTTSTTPALPETCVERVARFIAEQLTGLNRIADDFVHSTASVGNDGYVITLDVTQYAHEFYGPDKTVRVLLHLTPPVAVTTVDTDPEPETAA